MKRRGLAAYALMLLCGASAVRAGWDQPTSRPSPTVGSFFGHLVGMPDRTEDEEKADKADKAERPAARPPAAAATTAAATRAVEPKPNTRPTTPTDLAVNAREQEMQALLRRQKVCLQLMQIALETNDAALMRQAEQLDERARELYNQRTAHLPAGPDVSFESDQKSLEKYLSGGNSIGRDPDASKRGGRTTDEARMWGERP